MEIEGEHSEGWIPLYNIAQLAQLETLKLKTKIKEMLVLLK